MKYVVVTEPLKYHPDDPKDEMYHHSDRTFYLSQMGGFAGPELAAVFSTKREAEAIGFEYALTVRPELLGKLLVSLIEVGP